VTDFSSATKDLIQYKIFKNLSGDLFSPIMNLPDGYTALGTGPVSGPTSGALDYVRSPLLTQFQFSVSCFHAHRLRFALFAATYFPCASYYSVGQVTSARTFSQD
jgi:hypothetical protein